MNDHAQGLPWDNYNLLPSFLIGDSLISQFTDQIKTRPWHIPKVSSINWLPTIWKLRHNNALSTGDTERPVDKCIQSQHTFLSTQTISLNNYSLLSTACPLFPQPDTITHPSQIPMCHHWKVHGKDIRGCSEGKKTKLCKYLKTYFLWCLTLLTNEVW